MVNVAKKFINFGYHSMYWTHPCLQSIMRSRVPVGLVWGEEDNIMPVETGRITVELCRKLSKDVGLSVVSGAGHTPFHFEGGREFAEKVWEACEQVLLVSNGDYDVVATGQDKNTKRDFFSDGIIRSHMHGLLDETYVTECRKRENIRNSASPNAQDTSLLQVHDAFEIHYKHEHKYMPTTRWVSSFSLHATRENIKDMYQHLHASVDRIAELMRGDDTGDVERKEFVG